MWKNKGCYEHSCNTIQSQSTGDEKMCTAKVGKVPTIYS